MPSQSDIASQILLNLQAVEPDLDTSIGTTIRKIIDVFSGSLADGYLDNDLSDSQYDVTALTGSALDDFVQNFGLMRFPAKTATGIATFSRPANQSSIPYQAVYI